MLKIGTMAVSLQGMIAFSLGYKNGYEDGKKLNAPGVVEFLFLVIMSSFLEYLHGFGIKARPALRFSSCY